MKRTMKFVSIAILVGSLLSTAIAADVPVDQRVKRLMDQMTLEEKIGQLNQINADTKQANFDAKQMDALIASGKVGSVIYSVGAARNNRLQKIAVEQSRLHIPILFSLDVIHGYRTIFPIPLAMASTWDTSAVRKAARVSAVEASASGIRWTFAPMLDIARDPRWGRISESAGEDPVLTSRMAEAWIDGFQTSDLSHPDALAACAKHYVGYGAAEGGRDYNSVDMSEVRLRETYLPPFLAASNAHVATFMSSFNSLNGLPASANSYILRQILKREWDFHGFVVSDWNAIGELIAHGVAPDKSAAAALALRAGVDMDMSSGIYIENLAALVRSGKVSEAELDDAVRRVLLVKFQLGLFDHPYSDPETESRVQLTAENRHLARTIAAESLVLLKNEANLLPLKKSRYRIAVLGPVADDPGTMLGNWIAEGKKQDAVTILAGIRAKCAEDCKVDFAAGGSALRSSSAEIEDAVRVASSADKVVLVLGETGDMSGEATSRANLGFPGDQEKLLEAVAATKKPVILIMTGGRPLAVTWAAEHVPAILEAWLPGTEGGNAVADVLFGDVNPGGHLPVTIPRSVGQVPLYYAALPTGRPAGSDPKYFSGYSDSSVEPLFPFGFGLSYSQFSISNLTPTSESNSDTGKPELRFSVTVKNLGPLDGTEVVQLYAALPEGELSHPSRRLVAFDKVSLKAGESRQIEMRVPRSSYLVADQRGQLVVEEGTYHFFAGNTLSSTLETSLQIRAEKVEAGEEPLKPAGQRQ